MTKLVTTLEKIYATAKVRCDSNEKCLSIEPGLTELFEKSRDQETLLNAWKEWGDQSGKLMRHDFTRIIQIMNKAAKFSGFKDTAEAWMSGFEDTGFEKNLDDLFENKVMPLYRELHTYVRRKIEKFYGFKDKKHLIPANLLGIIIINKFLNV